MANKYPLTLNTELWTQQSRWNGSLSIPSHGFLRGVCVHGPVWGAETVCMKGWDAEAGGMREGYSEMLVDFINQSENIIADEGFLKSS